MAEKEGIVQKGYDKIARDYQANRHVFDNRKELEEFVSSLPRDAKVLDVGCGAGVPVAKYLVESRFDVTGIDFSGSMLKLARKNVSQAKFVKKDMTNSSFKENSFDGLVASYSLIHVPREKHFSVFKSFHRILKPNAVMLISLGPDEFEGTAKYYGADMFWSHYRPEESLQLIKNAGFQIIFDKYVATGGEKHYWILATNKKQSRPMHAFDI